MWFRLQDSGPTQRLARVSVRDRHARRRVVGATVCAFSSPIMSGVWIQSRQRRERGDQSSFSRSFRTKSETLRKNDHKNRLRLSLSRNEYGTYNILYYGSTPHPPRSECKPAGGTSNHRYTPVSGSTSLVTPYRFIGDLIRYCVVCYLTTLFACHVRTTFSSWQRHLCGISYLALERELLQVQLRGTRLAHL